MRKTKSSSIKECVVSDLVIGFQFGSRATPVRVVLLDLTGAERLRQHNCTFPSVYFGGCRGFSASALLVTVSSPRVVRGCTSLSGLPSACWLCHNRRQLTIMNTWVCRFRGACRKRTINPVSSMPAPVHSLSYLPSMYSTEWWKICF